MKNEKPTLLDAALVAFAVILAALVVVLLAADAAASFQIL